MTPLSPLRVNYICYLHRRPYIDKFYIDFIIMVIKLQNFRCQFFFSSMVKQKFALVITLVIKFPRKKDKKTFLDKWKNMTRQILFSGEKFFKYLANKGVRKRATWGRDRRTKVTQKK